MKEVEKIVLEFNNNINCRDLEGLIDMMSDDHVFIDSAGEIVQGVNNMRSKVWEPFFEQFPDYQNHFETIQSRGDAVIVTGYSTCSDGRLGVRAVWAAEISGGKVKEWRIYQDTEQNRKALGIWKP